MSRPPAHSLHLAVDGPTVGEFVRRFGLQASLSRGYTLATVFARVLENVTLVRDRRGVPRRFYEADELMRRRSGHNPAELPLELLRLRSGDLAERRPFSDIQQRFRELTEVDFDLRVRQYPQRGPLTAAELFAEAQAPVVQAAPPPRFEIDVRIIDGDLDVPLEFAGAGRWEALILSAALREEPRAVVVLDEPATSLHATLQRRLLEQLRRRRAQTLLITHSPFLVPASRLDMKAIVRLKRSRGVTETHRIEPLAPAASKSAQKKLDREAEQQAARLEQLLCGSADVRALLFADAVLLLEGGTEFGALERWLPRSKTAQELGAPEDVNLVLADVGGDTAFGAFINYLDSFGIPWAVLSDGKALDPDYPHSLLGQVPQRGNAGQPADKDFEEWRRYWKTQGVFTLAGGFENEIEQFFERVNEQARRASIAMFANSKVRAGSVFAGEVDCPAEVDELYREVLQYLGLTRL